MPRILPVPDMNIYEYVLEVDKGRRGIGQNLRHRVLRKKAIPPDPWAVSLITDPKNIGGPNWVNAAGSVPVVTVLPAIGAYPTPARIASDGLMYCRRASGAITLQSGVPVKVRVLYRTGTSANFGVYITVGTSTVSLLSGPIGNLSSMGTAAGTWSAITNTDAGNAFYLIEATFTPGSTADMYTLGVSPRSSTIGETTDVLAAMLYPATP